MLGWLGRGGQAPDFEEVALVHLDLLYRTALRLTHDRAEADDLVQETWLRALRHFDQFDPGSNCRAWLVTILRNAFLNRLRRQGRERLESDMTGERGDSAPFEDSAIERSTPEDEFFQTIFHGDVERALKSLSPDFQQVIVLADLEGFTYKEIAQVLNCPIGTVMSRLSRARQLLRTELRTLARAHGYSEESR
jgi:RNA polymerase sigma-70 factor (ECF subfamily)